MKVRCNVCGSKEIIELPEPEEGIDVCCEFCFKVLAEGQQDWEGDGYWYIPDSKYDEDFGGIPVEIIEY